ncbi:hypothetical protein HID58_024556 [Brassica napus]|uniref:QWRF motif-containing protein 3 n=2 Tax=Brassica napus TaxID=3708 RepID=A0ABQ8CKM4_BRANA|nr:hypothetical protein HID58_024556 [Brassica napus]CDY31937.1 BnaA07g00580D [Brassica napus]
MKSCEHENVSLKTTSRGKSRVVSSRFLSPTSSSSPIRRNSTSNSSANNVHLGLRKHDRMSDGIPNQSNGPEVDTKENRRRIDDEDNVILPGRFSVDECALHRSSSSRRNSRSSLLYYNDESDSELSDVSFASTTLSTSRSLSRSHKPGIKVSSKYLHDASKGCTTNNTRLQQGSQSFRGGIESRTNSAARYGSSMSQWALSPGRSLEAHQASSIYPSSNLKPPRGKGVGKLFNLGLDFFRRSKNKSSPISSPLKPKTEASHQLKLMNNRLVQWRFVNARASAANNNVASRAKKQLLSACDALTKLQNLVLQERINLQKKQLEMKLAHLLVSQDKHLEAWEDMGRQHFSSISMTTQALHSLLSRVPLREGAKVKIESAVTIFQKGEAVSDGIISTVNSFAPTIEDIVPLASQLAEVVAQEKLMLEQCHDLLRMISELEMQERSLKCCLMIQHKKDFV